jgi:quercetin dioxygenase-like cupin family protein
MMPARTAIVFAMVMALISCSQQIGVMKFAEGKYQHSVTAENIQWLPCPPNVPKGCQLVILEGNPKQTDLFSVRFKLDTDFYMRPHTHPRDERVTILDGQVRVAFGKDTDREHATVFHAGDYYVNARDAIHSVWIDKPTILQITGIGPWQVDFITSE